MPISQLHLMNTSYNKPIIIFPINRFDLFVYLVLQATMITEIFFNYRIF